MVSRRRRSEKEIWKKNAFNFWRFVWQLIAIHNRRQLNAYWRLITIHFLCAFFIRSFFWRQLSGKSNLFPSMNDKIGLVSLAPRRHYLQPIRREIKMIKVFSMWRWKFNFWIENARFDRCQFICLFCISVNVIISVDATFKHLQPLVHSLILLTVGFELLINANILMLFFPCVLCCSSDNVSLCEDRSKTGFLSACTRDYNDFNIFLFLVAIVLLFDVQPPPVVHVLIRIGIKLIYIFIIEWNFAASIFPRSHSRPTFYSWQRKKKV